jgi:cellobiose phosphorylase
MNYIPGQIHENFQKEHFFLINNDFAWSNCGPKRLSEMSDSKDWDDTVAIDLVKGDVVVVRFFKSSPTSVTYTYLERVYNGECVVEYKKESIISFGFIQSNKEIFMDITKSFERDKKIETILKEYERIIQTTY